MKKWWNSDIAVLIKRLGIVYLVLFLCRIVFYIYNRNILGAVESNEFWSLFKGSLKFDTVSVLYFNVVFIVFSLIPFRVRENRIYRGILMGYYAVANSLIVIVNLSDAVYFNYTQKRFTADEAFFAGNDNSFHLILKFAAENWYLILLGLVFIWGLVWLYKKSGKPSTPIRNKFAYFAFNTLILVGAIGLSIGGVRGGFTRATRPITLSNATLYTASVTKANLILSNPFCIIRTIGETSIKYQKYFSEDELSEIFTPYHFPEKHDKVLGRRNVVIFIMESFSAEHSALLNPDLYPDGKGYTPFLDSLMSDGYNFTSAFSNGHKSIDALPSVFASIPSLRTPFVLLPQSLGQGEAMPKIFSNEGYTTSFFCGSSHGSMGFGAYANLAGIKELYSREQYEAINGTKDFDNYWGIWDEPFLGYMSEILDDTPAPFFASVFTLSSHHPFVVPDKYKDILPDGKTKIHKGVAYTDNAVRKFFERSHDKEWFDNTIFVFVADHVSSETFAPKSLNPTGKSHIITFFYTPDGALKGSDNSVMQQINIMPTLLGLMGYEKPYFAFGKDMIGEPERKSVALNYTNQCFQIITDSVSVYFDQSNILGAYLRSDTLQENNIALSNNGEVFDAERMMKAFIQQYYEHIERKSYVVPADARRQ